MWHQNAMPDEGGGILSKRWEGDLLSLGGDATFLFGRSALAGFLFSRVAEFILLIMKLQHGLGGFFV